MDADHIFGGTHIVVQTHRSVVISNWMKWEISFLCICGKVRRSRSRSV